MPGPNRGTSSLFERLLCDMKKTDFFTFVGKPWCNHLYIQKIASFLRTLADITEILDNVLDANNRYVDEDTFESHRVLDASQVKRMHDMLYEIACNNIRFLSPGLPGAEDEYENCPLVAIYICIASCVMFMRQCFPFDNPEEDYYTLCPRDIPYCVKYDLSVVSDVPVQNFSLQELLCSMMHIERRTHALTFANELTFYVDALDMRVCDFLLCAMPDVAHNVEGCRVRYRNTDLYTCNTSTEYQLVILILSLRQMIESAVPVWRTVDAPTAPPRTEEDDLLINAVQAKFISEIQSVYGDSIEDAFYKMYTNQSIANSEGYLFFKANSVAARTEPGLIIRQFRDIPQWRHIADMAAHPVSNYLLDPSLDFLGFKIAFNLAANLFFKQTLKMPWFSFSTDGDNIRLMDGTQYRVLIEESFRVPIVVFLLNDAGIFYKGRLTIYGRHHTDYYHALIQWMTIIRQDLNSQYQPCRSIMPLVEMLLDMNLNAPARPAADLDVADFAENFQDSLYVNPTQILREMSTEDREYQPPPPVIFSTQATPLSVFLEKSRARVEFEHISQRIETKPQEVNANSILGDTDEAGFPQTTRSAWD